MVIENATVMGLILALQAVIVAGASIRLLLIALSVMADPDKSGELKKRAKNTLAFLALSACLTGLVGVIYNYYS